MLENMEKLVRAALDCGLTGPVERKKLMDGIPRGFVFSLPTVSRPIDQLRFDLMELERTPRLIGLDRPPFAVWLENAAMICATAGHTDQAQMFAETADWVHPEGRVMQRVALSIKPSGVEYGVVMPKSRPAPNPAPVTPPAPSSSLDMPHHRQLRVLQIHPDARDAWRSLDPPLDPQGRVHAVQTLKGSWYLNHAPNSAVWREAVKNLDAALEVVDRQTDCHDYLGVFARLPEALGAILGSRLTGREGVVICDPAEGWKPWGPAWFSPVLPSYNSKLQIEGLPRSTPDELTVVVEVGETLDPVRVDAALEAAWAPYPPRVRITSTAREINNPETIERMVADLEDFTATLRAQYGGLNKIHLFYRGPLPLMVRWAQTLHDCPFEVVVYTDQSNGDMVPAVKLGEGLPAELVEGGSVESTHNDVFIVHHPANSLYAERLRQALVEEGLRVTCGAEAPANVRSIITLISPSTEPMWYHQIGFSRIINHVRCSEGERRLIPVLIGGARRRDLPYGLNIIVPFDANGKDAYMVGVQLASIVAPD